MRTHAASLPLSSASRAAQQSMHIGLTGCPVQVYIAAGEPRWVHRAEHYRTQQDSG